MGFFTNVCVETTTRMSGNMGFDTYLVHDACASMNVIGHDGTYYEPDLVHNMAVGNLHGEFAQLLAQKTHYIYETDASHINRVQGNE